MMEQNDPVYSIGCIPRNIIEASNNIIVADFILLHIDYRTCGDVNKQLSQLQIDYDGIYFRAKRTGRDQQVARAKEEYVRLIKSNYRGNRA